MAIVDFPLPDLAAAPPGLTARFLLQEGRRIADTGELMRRYCAALRDEGVPVARSLLLIPTLHPQVRALNFVWNDVDDTVTEIARAWRSVDSPEFQASPLRCLFTGTHEVLRRCIARPDCPRDFPIVEELAAQGFTDYVVLRIDSLLGNIIGALSFSTKAPGGFSDDELRRALATVPYFTPILDTHTVRRIAAALLGVYLGGDAGPRVLDGAVKRGDGESLHAAVCFTDLRDFTVLSDRLPRVDLLELLDSYFDCVVSAVHDHGGEVLKFIGDAVLAVFRAPAGGEGEACRRALAAAEDAFVRAQATNARREAARPGAQPIEFGMSIHVGEVMYGNIGGPDRLDFTVIGPAVNLASRIQGMCRPLGRPLLVSEAFVKAAHIASEDLGLHKLKGVADDARLFAPRGDVSAMTR